MTDVTVQLSTSSTAQAVAGGGRGHVPTGVINPYQALCWGGQTWGSHGSVMWSVTVGFHG